MKETRMPPALLANLVANNGNTIYGVSVIDLSTVMAYNCFLHYWPFVRGIYGSLVDPPHKEPVMQTFDDFFVVSRTNCWTRSWVAHDMICHVAHVIWLCCMLIFLLKKLKTYLCLERINCEGPCLWCLLHNNLISVWLSRDLQQRSTYQR